MKKKKIELTTPEIVEAIHKMKYCSQDNIPNDEKKVIARFYMLKFKKIGSHLTISECGNWFVLEDSMYDEPSENFANNFGKVVFGAVDLGYGLELGDFSIEEIERIDLAGVVPMRDTSFKPLEITMGELRKIHNLEWMV